MSFSTDSQPEEQRLKCSAVNQVAEPAAASTCPPFAAEQDTRARMPVFTVGRLAGTEWGFSDVSRRSVEAVQPEVTVGAVALASRDTSSSRSKVLKGIKRCRLSRAPCVLCSLRARLCLNSGVRTHRTCGQLHWPAATRFKKSTTIVLYRSYPKGVWTHFFMVIVWNSRASTRAGGALQGPRIGYRRHPRSPERESDHPARMPLFKSHVAPTFKLSRRTPVATVQVRERSVVTGARQERAIGEEAIEFTGRLCPSIRGIVVQTLGPRGEHDAQESRPKPERARRGEKASAHGNARGHTFLKRSRRSALEVPYQDRPINPPRRGEPPAVR